MTSKDKYKTVENFVWNILTYEKAKNIFKENLKEVFILNDDNSESLIESEESLNKAINSNKILAQEVGYII